MAEAKDAPLTTVIARRARPGKESEYEAWLEGIIAASKTFEGHESVTVLKPPPGGGEYVLVVRWRDFASSKRWVESEVRAEWLAKLGPLAEAGRVEAQSGLETWFTLAPAHGVAPPAPSRRKMAVVTFVAIYPLILILSYVLLPHLEALPIPLRPLVMSGILVPLMTWVVMPNMTRLFWPWLYPGFPRPSR